MSDERPAGAPAGRVFVLLGSALALAGSGVVSFLVLLFWPVLAHLPGLTAGIVFGVVGYVLLTVGAIALANLLAVRRDRTWPAAALGCGTLVAGTVLGLGVLVAALAAAS